MADPYIGEIRMFGGNFPPNGWLFCEGQLMPISENEVLYQLIGTTYGGDGQETFALPDLRGRIPIHQGISAGQSFIVGESGGAEAVTLISTQIPSHTHTIACDPNNGSSVTPQGNAVAGSALNPYNVAGTDIQMGSQMIGVSGGSQPHENMMPYLCVNFIISLFGIFPSQT